MYIKKKLKLYKKYKIINFFKKIKNRQQNR